MCGESRGTAWCPHAFICGSRFISNSTAEKKVQYQALRRTRLTFPALQEISIVEEDDEDDRIRSEELMNDDNQSMELLNCNGDTDTTK